MIHRALLIMPEISLKDIGHSSDQDVKTSGMFLSQTSRMEPGIKLQRKFLTSFEESGHPVKSKGGGKTTIYYNAY